MTWGGREDGEPDGVLFTAYGDGRGFEPLVERKLSLGLARIAGGAGDFRAVNLRSPSAEQVGDGVRGRKASGLLMVDGVLFMLVRNTLVILLLTSLGVGISIAGGGLVVV